MFSVCVRVWRTEGGVGDRAGQKVSGSALQTVSVAGHGGGRERSASEAAGHGRRRRRASQLAEAPSLARFAPRRPSLLLEGARRTPSSSLLLACPSRRPGRTALLPLSRRGRTALRHGMHSSTLPFHAGGSAGGASELATTVSSKQELEIAEFSTESKGRENRGAAEQRAWRGTEPWLRRWA